MGLFNNFLNLFRGPLLTAQNTRYLTLSDGTQIQDTEIEILRRLGVNESILGEANSRAALREIVNSIVDIEKIQTEEQFIEAMQQVGNQCEISENGISAFVYSNNREEYENPKHPVSVTDTTHKLEIFINEAGNISINQAKEIRTPRNTNNGQVEVDRRIYIDKKTLAKNWRGKYITESELKKSDVETIIMSGISENENIYEFLANNNITEEELEQDVANRIDDEQNIIVKNKHEEARTEAIPTQQTDNEKTEQQEFLESIRYKGDDLIDPAKNDDRTLYKNILIQMGISEECLRKDGNTSSAFINALQVLAEGQSLETIEDVKAFIEANKGIVKGPNEIEVMNSYFYENNTSIMTKYMHVVTDKGTTNIEEASKWNRITQDGILISKEMAKERTYQDDLYIIENIRKENPTYKVIDSKTGNLMQIQGDARTFLEETVPSIEEMASMIDLPRKNWEKYQEGEVIDLAELQSLKEEEKILYEEQSQIGE